MRRTKKEMLKTYKRILKQVEKELADYRDKGEWFGKEREAYVRNLKNEIWRLEGRL
jgi:hypothetical protein